MTDYKPKPICIGGDINMGKECRNCPDRYPACQSFCEFGIRDRAAAAARRAARFAAGEAEADFRVATRHRKHGE